MRKIKFVLPAIAAGALFIFAGCSEGVAEGEGRRGAAERTVEAGRGRAAVDTSAENRRYEAQDGVPATPVSLTQLAGTLSYDDPEWYLDTGSEVVLLHLGNRGYLESLDVDLEEGGSAVVFGIMEEDGISVVRMTTDEGEMAFRSDSGVPLWAGNGNRAQEQPGEPRGGGRYADEREPGAENGPGAGEGRGQGSGRGAGQGAGRTGGNGPGRVART
ncbi:MAG: hypothetical protein JW852_03800 [Spirochaetales bacterium]|nr:hypothetical protein [Spirochaetales bacterium]